VGTKLGRYRLRDKPVAVPFHLWPDRIPGALHVGRGERGRGVPPNRLGV